MEITPLFIQELAEDCDLEVKKAAGRDGMGELPRSFFETYSAMANTRGGYVLLGIEEKPKGVFRVSGITNTAKVIKALWDNLNNRQVVNVNLLTENMLETLDVDGLMVIRVRIPRAFRAQRPVFLGPNPLTGSYRRNSEGDYLCDEMTVRRMMAEQVEDTRDSQLLEHYGFDDLDESTLNAYRNHLKAAKPDHPWLDYGNMELLRSLGGWARNRETGQEGLTLAGLLMFGKLRSILDVVPNYILDYQERPEPRADARWIDRLTTDGTWSGNLYDFYRRVSQKLFRDLKVPFRLKGTTRVDETPVHEALREALVNTLIHADYSGRVSVLVVKRPDLFGFRNPGVMRIPLEDALRGGTSDCRNRNLQKMFQLVGLGEQAGSGIPRVYRNWKKQHWRLPELGEKLEPDQTLLAMRMVSLLPDETIEILDQRFGPKFRQLTETQRLALATVAIEGMVTHARLKNMTGAHPHDITKTLTSLVKDGFLESDGASRGTFYFFPGEPPMGETGLLELDYGTGVGSGNTDMFTGFTHRDSSAEHLMPPSSVHLVDSSVRLDDSSVHLQMLEQMTENIRSKGKVPRTQMEEALVRLCDERFLSIKELAELLDRSPETLRIHYLNKMVKSGQMELRFPDKPSHPEQCYRTKKTI